MSNWINNNSVSADHEELPTSHESSTENLRNASNSSDEQTIQQEHQEHQNQVVRNALSLLTNGFQAQNNNSSNNNQSNVQNGLKK